MPGREYTAQSVTGYRFGFNGKENSDEICGEGNAVDFGARIYDSRLGRWFSVDPLQVKYPEFSPFIYAANNPVIFVDYCGKDYGIKIDNKAKTVMIVATVYAIKEHSEEAKAAASLWTNENGKYQLEVKTVVKKGFLGIGRKFKTEHYDVIFQINVEEKTTFQDRDVAFNEDQTGYANTYVVAPKDEKVINPNSKKEVSGYSIGGTIRVGFGKQVLFNTGSHELGHILGLPHWRIGLMMTGETRPPNEKTITKGMVSRILINPGVLKRSLFQFGQDLPSESLQGDAKSSYIGDDRLKGKTKLIQKKAKL